MGPHLGPFPSKYWIPYLSTSTVEDGGAIKVRPAAETQISTSTFAPRKCQKAIACALAPANLRSDGHGFFDAVSKDPGGESRRPMSDLAQQRLIWGDWPPSHQQTLFFSIAIVLRQILGYCCCCCVVCGMWMSLWRWSQRGCTLRTSGRVQRVQRRVKQGMCGYTVCVCVGLAGRRSLLIGRSGGEEHGVSPCIRHSTVAAGGSCRVDFDLVQVLHLCSFIRWHGRVGRTQY